MKNIIITFQDEINYGAALQAYALYHKLSEYGSTKILNYSMDSSHQCGIKEKIINNMPKAIIKKNRFRNFMNKKTQLTRKVKTINEVETECKEYDNLVFGSDQIWAFDITKDSKDVYLANYNTYDENVISYAASIGKETISKDNKEYLIKSLKNYSSISVREESAKKIIGDKYNCEIVLDPTLLLTSKEWEDSLQLENKNNKYILVYMLDHSDALTNAAKEIGDKMNMKIIHFNNINRFGKRGVSKSAADPRKFAELFKNASFVLTNSFHGLAFSIIFEKQFICFLHKTKSTRQENLLKKLELKNRIYDDKTGMDIYLKEKIDYNKTKKLLEKERKQSLDFIDKSLRK